MEPVRVCEFIEEALSPFNREKRINQCISRVHEMGTGRENTEGDSVYLRRIEQMNDRKSGKEEEMRVLRAFGTAIESPIGSTLEESLKIVTADILKGEDNSQIQNDEQSYTPLGGGIEGRSGEARIRLGGEVVQPDIQDSKEERKVEKDLGLQGAKRGSAGKALQDGYPGDSGGTPGGERLDDHSVHIVSISACQGRRAIQSLSVLQLSKSMLRFRGDAIWCKGCAQNIYKDNEMGCVIYQRTAEGEAYNISGRHSPHASRQRCIEIDLTGDSPVPEKSGLDSVRRETEFGTRKERGVS
ncbi:uncharacterized protein MONOS_13351 [Monocercomonoides exilis]|uniref:uncharacterized protein n=1 Tax=Monocercomonoides exilis TaxID=2049356 RepID=UPI0035598297|nr:hypothetical protein MONOS_13351 [Monocercomonoides exilis]|eukprot:MONOS_13351.1-p1 / transcript=MONOS_13351.1 / gene=MONOS_13351 / organism=Monocercomonoides_exilis_PA203 / gene_product=unspecified product / transcript_product=unspecified product / location=Mono_scaffold00814:18838-19945(-) / protein_length=299 / sequence_SO=supercontig / SO=protein_coding / is_pseudo=false